jgi:beta-phosphoglucomutase-like phosphatase (HAD superfamily)
MKHNVIFDLDGTLADCEHRRHLVTGDKKDWNAFFKACVDDEPIKPIINLLKMYRAQGCKIYILSGRSASVMTETRLWIERHVGSISSGMGLAMREEGDFRPDRHVKIDMQIALGLEPDNTEIVFEERQCVVDMWRELGFRCCQVAPGDFKL